ncbi:energy transducer TonB [Hymenobacter sp. RP-2-7]|uniref:Energy transducer TonB n=1 Tax=Hymenobacter polaris TaxID=2682546 RepID=A0A7Y0FMH5_9BACT|nr:energy transducer TonB [Hymenobacter polaris]NML65862.1 energy transducer TonB [Hymenobacter polaris]
MHLLTASLDDIVFEGRNQAYGAYQLRQQYRSNLASAGGITLGVCMLLMGSWLAWPATRPKPLVENHVIVETMVLPPTVVEPPKQAALAPAHAPLPPRTHPAPAQPTVVAKDNLVPPPPKPALTQEIDLDGLTGPTTTGPTDPLATGPATSTTIGGPGTEAGPPATSETFTFVEKMPEFAGGQAALLRYLRDHLRYPSQALREQAEGRVFMSFVVRADGTIADVTVLKGLGFGLDEEALRVVRQMPAWMPGYQAQHAVAVRFTLPITFNIQ